MNRLVKRILPSCLRILAGVPIVGLTFGGLLLLVLGATARGRSVGLSAAVLGGVLFCSIGYWNRNWFKRIRTPFLALLLPAGSLLYLVPMILAPDGGKPDAQGFETAISAEVGPFRGARRETWCPKSTN